MSIANGLALPNPLSNGTTADAVQAMGDFNYLLAALNRALLDAGGGAGMNAQSTQIHNLANGTSANDAVNLSQLNGYAALSGAVFTGGISGTTLSLSSTLGVGGLLTATGGLNTAGSISLTATTMLLKFTDANGGNPSLSVDGSNNLTLAGTNASGAPTAVWFVGMHNNSPTFNIVPAVSLQGTLAVSGALTSGSAANCVGYLGVPSNVKTANYGIVTSDMGQSIDMNGTGLTVTLGALPDGFACLISNLNASNLTIASGTSTLIWSGTTTTGSRTLGQNGEARVHKKNGNIYISGTALS